MMGTTAGIEMPVNQIAMYYLRSLFIFPTMSRGLSPSRAQAGPRPWTRLRLQYRLQYLLEA